MHAWKWQGPNLVCEACGLKLLHTKPRIQLEQRCKAPCAARETVRYEGVHATHQLVLRHQTFQRSLCGGVLSITSPDKIPAILGKSGEFYRKVQHKSPQAPLSQNNTLQSFFRATADSQREEGSHGVAQGVGAQVRRVYPQAKRSTLGTNEVYPLLRVSGVVAVLRGNPPPQVECVSHLEE